MVMPALVCPARLVPFQQNICSCSQVKAVISHDGAVGFESPGFPIVSHCDRGSPVGRSQHGPSRVYTSWGPKEVY